MKSYEEHVQISKNLLGALRKNADMLCDELVALQKESSEHHDALKEYPENDLRRTVFKKFQQYFGNLMLTLKIASCNDTLEYLSKINIQEVDYPHLFFMFQFCWRETNCALIELIECVIAAIVMKRFPHIKRKDLKFIELVGFEPSYNSITKTMGFVPRKNKRQEHYCFAQALLAEPEREFLYGFYWEKRNHRHNNYYIDESSISVSCNWPPQFDDYNKLLLITKKLVAHSTVSNLEHIIDPLAD